jgi:hypothetical protein
MQQHTSRCNPDEASYHNNRAYCYDKLNNPDAAIYDMRMAVELDPKEAYKAKLTKLMAISKIQTQAQTQNGNANANAAVSSSI